MISKQNTHAIYAILDSIKGVTTDRNTTDNCDVEDIINKLKEVSEKYQVEKIKDELKKLIR